MRIGRRRLILGAFGGIAPTLFRGQSLVVESAERRLLSVSPLTGYPAEMGRWLWSLEDVRWRLKEDVQDLSAEVLDWMPAGGENSIGTLLYHIAITEIDWLYDVVPEPRSEQVNALLPWPFHTNEGRLTPVVGIPLSEHLARLDRARAHLLACFREFSPEAFYQPVSQPGYEVTPEWVLYHLVEHEALHYGQILSLKRRARERTSLLA